MSQKGCQLALKPLELHGMQRLGLLDDAQQLEGRCSIAGSSVGSCRADSEHTLSLFSMTGGSSWQGRWFTCRRGLDDDPKGQ